MKLLSCLILVSALSSGFAFGQNKWTAGFEAGFASDHKTVQDTLNGRGRGRNPGYLEKTGSSGPLGAITIRRDLGKRFFLETGLQYKSYERRIDFTETDAKSFGTFGLLSIPLRIGAQLPVASGKITADPFAGVSIGIATTGENGFLNTTLTNKNQPPSYFWDYRVENSLKPGTQVSLEFGAGINYAFAKRLSIGLRARYSIAIGKPPSEEILYIIGGTLYYPARQEFQSFVCGTLRLAYQL